MKVLIFKFKNLKIRSRPMNETSLWGNAKLGLNVAISFPELSFFSLFWLINIVYFYWQKYEEFIQCF